MVAPGPLFEEKPKIPEAFYALEASRNSINMDALVSQLQDTFEGQIVSSLLQPEAEGQPNKIEQDFEGQKIAELFCTVLLSLTGVCLYSSI